MDTNQFYLYSVLQRDLLKYICNFNFLEITHLGYSTLKGIGITIDYPQKNMEFAIEILDKGRLILTILKNDEIEKLVSFDIESESSTLNKIEKEMEIYFN